MTIFRSAVVVAVVLAGWGAAKAQHKKAAFEAEVIHITPKAIFREQ